jgi:hypothetical protein
MLAAVLAAGLSVQPFRYERSLQPAGAGPVQLIPDGALYAHARGDFADLRVLDAAGEQVPWRPEPVPAAPSERALPVRDTGRRGASAVARVDLGANHRAIDRLTLDVPDAHFVGSVTVLGSDDRTAWTELGTTEIYSVAGAAPARSTTALLPETDFRYLELRATHVTRIDGVSVATLPHRAPLRTVAARVHAGSSIVVVDLGHRNVPVDELRIESSTRRYDRSFTVEAGGAVVAAGRLVRVGGARPTVVPLTVRARALRIRVANGDDPPLRGLRVVALARPRTLVLEGGHRGPFTLYYGGSVRPPVYEFARLPSAALALDRARPGALAAERRNPDFQVADRRSVFARHRSLVTVALGLAAAAVLAAGAAAFRRS